MENKTLVVQEFAAAYLLSKDFTLDTVQRDEHGKVMYHFTDADITKRALQDFESNNILSEYIVGLKRIRQVYNAFRREKRKLANENKKSSTNQK